MRKLDTNHKETKETKDSPVTGPEIFENYLAARNALVANLKRVIKVLIQCNALDVEPKQALDVLVGDKNLGWVSGHQWQYSSGHDTIYCQHKYKKPRAWIGPLESCTIKVQLALLGTPDQDIYKIYRDAALKDLKQKKAAIEAKIKKVTEPLKGQLDEVNEQINALNPLKDQLAEVHKELDALF